MIRAHVQSLDANVLPFIPRAWVAAFWAWAQLHADDVVLEVRVLFWTVKIRFRDLYPIFERILGRPVGGLAA